MVIQDIFGILGYIIALLVGIIGTFYAIKAIKKQNPVYFKTNSVIFVKTVPSFPELKITYKDVEVETLSSAKITFWNAGNARIEKNDVTDKAPLQIKAKEGIKIFSASIIEASTIENEFEIKIDEDGKTVHCSFKYLSKGDNVTIQIIHSGNSSDDIEFSGKFKDTGIPSDVTKNLSKSSQNYSMLRAFFILILSGLIFYLIFFYILRIFDVSNPNFNTPLVAFVYFIFLLFTMTIWLKISNYFFKRYFRSLFLFSTLPKYEPN